MYKIGFDTNWLIFVLLGQLNGLLGYYDNVTSNDFTARDRSSVASNSSTVDLHNYFVVSCETFWLLTTLLMFRQLAHALADWITGVQRPVHEKYLYDGSHFHWWNVD